MEIYQKAVFLGTMFACWLPMLCATYCDAQEAVKRPGPGPSVPKRIREPAVAGIFYPKDPAALSLSLDSLLANAKPDKLQGDLHALICPHAGYPYSGPVAATAYRLLQGHEYQTVVLIAVSHYALFSGASVARADIYRTPLGDVPVSSKAGELAKVKPFAFESHCLVQRPEWFMHASRSAPPEGEDTPETWEHSGEVQVPFLQKALKNFALVPIVAGETDPEQMACALADQWDDKTLIIASTDLSHYHPYDQARELDTRCVRTICNLDVERMRSQEACGRTPVLSLLYLARKMGWKAKLLDYRNSGDTAGSKESVVGYAAIALYSPFPQNYTTGERSQLLALARRTLKGIGAKGPIPAINADGFPSKFSERKGCFVTLTIGGELRGCIGNILPREPLYKAIIGNAESAALYDPRFNPVGPDELDKIEIEISVLTVPEALPFSSPDDLLSKLHPYRDGVVLKIGDKSATFLPQVWSQIPDKVDFLSALAKKAGCASSDWRNPGTEVLVYKVESFSESEM